jgi:tetratricopeptide (TPR) repeat protein
MRRVVPNSNDTSPASPGSIELHRASRALEEARRAASIDRRHAPRLIAALAELGSLRRASGDYDRAERLYREALAHSDQAAGADAVRTLGIRSLLAYTLDCRGDTAAAIHAYHQILDEARQQGQGEAETAAVIHNNLGMLYKKSGDHDAAALHYQSALVIFTRLKGESSPEVACVYNNLGVLHYSRLDAERARELHQRALTIRQRIYGETAQNYDLYQSYTNLAAVHKVLGEYAVAESFQSRAETCNGFAPDAPPPEGLPTHPGASPTTRSQGPTITLLEDRGRSR